MSAGDDTCVLAMLCQQADGFLQRLRPMIFEWRGYQFALPSKFFVVVTRSTPSILYGSISAFFPAARNENRGQARCWLSFPGHPRPRKNLAGPNRPRTSRTLSARSVTGALRHWNGGGWQALAVAGMAVAETGAAVAGMVAVVAGIMAVAAAGELAPR